VISLGISEPAHQSRPYHEETLILLKEQNSPILYSKFLLWTIQVARLSSLTGPELKVHTLDYVIHRHIAAKLAQEQQLDEQEA
jgi:hypothetical protein